MIKREWICDEQNIYLFSWIKITSYGMQTHLYTLSLEVEGHHIIALQQTLKCTNQIQKKNKPNPSSMKGVEEYGFQCNKCNEHVHKPKPEEICPFDLNPQLHQTNCYCHNNNNAYVQKPLYNLKQENSCFGFHLRKQVSPRPQIFCWWSKQGHWDVGQLLPAQSVPVGPTLFRSIWGLGLFKIPQIDWIPESWNLFRRVVRKMPLLCYYSLLIHQTKILNQ